MSPSSADVSRITEMFRWSEAKNLNVQVYHADAEKYLGCDLPRPSCVVPGRDRLYAACISAALWRVMRLWHCDTWHVTRDTYTIIIIIFRFAWFWVPLSLWFKFKQLHIKIKYEIKMNVLDIASFRYHSLCYYFEKNVIGFLLLFSFIITGSSLLFWNSFVMVSLIWSFRFVVKRESSRSSAKFLVVVSLIEALHICGKVHTCTYILHYSFQFVPFMSTIRVTKLENFPITKFLHILCSASAPL